MLTVNELDDVLIMIDKLCAKQGWKSYQRRLTVIRERITAATPAPIPPLPAGSIINPDAPERINFRYCRECDSPNECSRWDGCGRGR